MFCKQKSSEKKITDTLLPREHLLSSDDVYLFIHLHYKRPAMPTLPLTTNATNFQIKIWKCSCERFFVSMQSLHLHKLRYRFYTELGCPQRIRTTCYFDPAQPTANNLARLPYNLISCQTCMPSNVSFFMRLMIYAHARFATGRLKVSRQIRGFFLQKVALYINATCSYITSYSQNMHSGSTYEIFMS